MPSALQVDKIIDGSATTNKELAEYASGNWSWGSGVPEGTVIQVKHDVNGTALLGSTTSDYPVASGFKLSITPKYQTSRILVIFNVDVWISDGTLESNKIGKFGIRLNSQSNQTVADKRFSGRYLGTGGDLGGEVTLMYLDDHDSTNSQEYELVLGRWSGSYDNTVSLNGGGFGKSTITLMEIA
jgi:hypothetical protein